MGVGFLIDPRAPDLEGYRITSICNVRCPLTSVAFAHLDVPGSDRKRLGSVGYNPNIPRL